MAIYMGGAKMGGEKASDIRSLASEIESQQKRFKEGMGWRNIIGVGGDILKKIIPGFGHILDFIGEGVADVAIDIGSSEDIKRKETAWTGSGYGEEFGAMQQEATPHFLERGLSQGLSYLGSEAGEKLMGDLTDKFWGDYGARTFGIGGKGFGEKVTAQGLKDNPWLAADYVDPDDWREGGRVPKFKGGGFFKGFGKKKKPEKDEALMALEAILSSKFPGGKLDLSDKLGYTTDKSINYEDGINLMRIISSFETPEGTRFYPGEGRSRNQSLAEKKAMMDAAARKEYFPSDSITTDQLAQLKKLDLFQEGGQVPNGGGNVQGGAPTISDYFSMQGLSLGGSNKQSLAEKLGRR